MLNRSGASISTCREAATETIELFKHRTAVFEHKESFTKNDRQSVMRMNRLLSSATMDFKNYHFTLIDSIEDKMRQVQSKESCKNINLKSWT